MKVRANNDIYDNGKLVFLKNEIYTVKVELPATYAIYTQMGYGPLRCFPKKFFTVVPEESLYRIHADKLTEYEDLEEKGKLLELSCAVGDTIYHLCHMDNGMYKIIEMKVCCVEPYGSIRKHKEAAEIWNIYAETDYTKEYFKFFDFGKQVFSSRKEAEAVLKVLKPEEGVESLGSFVKEMQETYRQERFKGVDGDWRAKL